MYANIYNMILIRAFQIKEMFIEEKELRINVKEWIEFRHKIIGESALQIKWILWAKICRPNNRDHVSETTRVSLELPKEW